MTDFHDEHNIYGDAEADEYHKLFGVPVIPVDPYKESDSFKAGKRDWDQTHRRDMPILIGTAFLLTIIVLLVKDVQ